ncbi:DUF3043 domain-containing protein [Acidipropionibacterium thoenii]|uniref:DUF3043 domain-containing protein n=1 Tax=Acidipropionibacterium thoenii TaxID=1751 RepID=UPI00041B8CFC|nr:DUF3043 domain-containing protein [Acidipropionibacterium thoenii]
MGLFRPYQQGQTETGRKKAGQDAAQTPPDGSEAVKQVEETTAPEAESASGDGQIQVTRRRGPQRKSGPTPSRAEAEAARMERLHPNLSAKEVRQQDRLSKREARMANLEAMEKRPERVLIRDFVDGRRTFSEFIMPVFLVVMVAWFVIVTAFPRTVSPIVLNAMTLVMLVVIALWVVDAVRLWIPVRKLLIARYPEISRRGLLSYLNNRAMTPRRWRKPVPTVRPARRGKA